MQLQGYHITSATSLAAVMRDTEFFVDYIGITQKDVDEC